MHRAASIDDVNIVYVTHKIDYYCMVVACILLICLPTDLI